MMETREHEFDLLTAALMGIAVGATVTMLLRRGPSGRRPIGAGLEWAGRGATLAGAAGLAGAKMAGRAAKRGMDALPLPDVEEVGERLHEYLDAAKGAFEDTIMAELGDLRKTIRRKRRRFGL